MARKEFRYRGFTTEQLKEMPLKEFMLLLPSRERRSLARGFAKEEQSLLKKLEKRNKVKTHERQMVVIPSMVGKNIMIHSGKEFVDMLITEEMIGMRLGQLILTRKRTAHTGGGIGGKTKSTPAPAKK